jgi:hypothetical protein
VEETRAWEFCFGKPTNTLITHKPRFIAVPAAENANVMTAHIPFIELFSSSIHIEWLPLPLIDSFVASLALSFKEAKTAHM